MFAKMSAAAISAFVLFSSSAAFASNDAPAGYVMDSRGNHVKSNFGLCWRTGSWTPAQATAECDPDLVKVAVPEPKPEYVSGIESVAVDTVRLNSDVMFAFGKSDVSVAGMKSLDELKERLWDTSVDTILVVGHTDRLGSEKFNQRLSERRAEAVKSYLVAKGFDASRISSIGKGESQPLTAKSDCKGVKGEKLKSCLAKDRRVEIVITGRR